MLEHGIANMKSEASETFKNVAKTYFPYNLSGNVISTLCGASYNLPICNTCSCIKIFSKYLIFFAREKCMIRTQDEFQMPLFSVSVFFNQTNHIFLFQHEERSHEPGMPYSWEAVDIVSANYTPDITPLILAAHKNNYEILKILLDRGASLPTPHDLKCSCEACITGMLLKTVFPTIGS